MKTKRLLIAAACLLLAGCDYPPEAKATTATQSVPNASSGYVDIQIVEAGGHKFCVVTSIRGCGVCQVIENPTK